MNKRKIIKNLIYIICCYVFLFIFYNSNLIVRKILFSCTNKISFINITIILCFIIMSILFIFRKYLFRKKIYMWITFLFLLLCCFAEGYYTDFSSYPFIILYMYLMLATFYIILKTKKCFELSMVYSFSIIILIAFILGLFGMLVIIKYIILLSSIYIIVCIYKKTKYNLDDIKYAINNIFSSGFIIFNLLWIFAILFGAGLYVHTFDEYSHWAYDAKAMIYYSKFGNSQDIMLRTRSYAPIFTVWHYIVSVFGGFSEHNLYVGLNILVSIYLLPAFIYLKNNNLFIKIFGFVSILFACYLFGGVYSYTTLYVDYAMTAIFASSIIIYFISKDKNINLNKLIILHFIILTLGKPNGFVISFVALTIIGINELIDSKINSIRSFFKIFFQLIVKYKNYILAIVITFLLWRVYVVFMNSITNDYYDFNLLPIGLKADLKYKLNYEFIESFLKKIIVSFDSNCIGGLIPLTLYKYIIVTIAFLYLLFYKLIGDVKKAFYKVLPFIISYILFFLLTGFSIFFAMSLHEARNLASFGRYLNWYNVAIVIFEIVLVLRIDFKKNFMFKVLFLLYIVISISFSNIFSFIINPIKSESYNVSVERNEKVKIIIDNVPKKSLIYIIDQKDIDGIMAMWYVRYYAFPRKTNSSASAINWKIKTENNEDDLQDWGFTAEKWANHLINYKFDYLFLYSCDDLFFEETKFMYDNYENAKKYSLFKIDYVGGNIKLIPVA